MIPVPIWRFSAHVYPFGSAVMAALTGYFDDSASGNNSCLSVAGFVGELDCWQVFEAGWQEALNAADVPYFHMKEIADPNSPLAKFTGRKNDAPRAKFFENLASVLENSKLWAFGALIRINDLKRFNADRGRRLEAIPLALYGCMTEIYAKEPPSTVEMVLDRIDKAESKIATAMEYASTDVHGDIGEAISILPLKGTDSFRNILGIQAADFLAWEVRKNHENISGWWETSARGDNPIQSALTQIQWLRKQGKKWPNQRNSYVAIGSAAYPNGGVWDYGSLCAEDSARNGVWFC